MVIINSILIIFVNVKLMVQLMSYASLHMTHRLRYWSIFAERYALKKPLALHTISINSVGPAMLLWLSGKKSKPLTNGGRSILN
jgi:hypothetical protein